MAIEATSYDPRTGRIDGHHCGQLENVELNAQAYVLGYYDGRVYYIETAAMPHFAKYRPEQKTSLSRNTVDANGQDLIIFSNLPAPCAVNIGEHRYEVEDGVLEWGTLMPGTYRVRVEAFPYLDWETEVTAVAGSASSDTE